MIKHQQFFLAIHHKQFRPKSLHMNIFEKVKYSAVTYVFSSTFFLNVRFNICFYENYL